MNTSLPPNFMQQWQTTARPSIPSMRHFSMTRDKIYLKKKPKQPFKRLWTKKCLRQIIVHVFKNLSNKKFYKYPTFQVCWRQQILSRKCTNICEYCPSQNVYCTHMHKILFGIIFTNIHAIITLYYYAMCKLQI